MTGRVLVAAAALVLVAGVAVAWSTQRRRYPLAPTPVPPQWFSR